MSQLLATSIFYDDWSQISENDAWRIIYHQEQHNDSESIPPIKYLLKLALRPNFKKIFKKLTPEQLADIYHDEGIFFNQPFYKFFLSHITTKRYVLAAPAEHLEDMNFMHFYYADAAFSEIAVLHHEQKDVEWAIDKFIATLYLPHNGANKVEFNKAIVEELAKEIVLMPFQKALILRAYDNIKKKIISRCPDVFPKVETDGEAAAPTYNGKMWQNAHFELSESAAFKGFDGVANTPLYTILDYLQNKAEQKPKTA